MPFSATPRGPVMFPTGADVLLVEMLESSQRHVLAQAMAVVRWGRSVCFGYDAHGAYRLYRRMRQARRRHPFAFQWLAARDEPVVLSRARSTPLLGRPLQEGREQAWG